MSKDINAPEDSSTPDKGQPQSLEPAEIEDVDLEQISGGFIDNKSSAWTKNTTPPNILCC